MSHGALEPGLVARLAIDRLEPRRRLTVAFRTEIVRKCRWTGGFPKRWICDRVLLPCLDRPHPTGARTHLMDSTTVGRKGTLANPEVYENVPGHVIPIIEREFDDFDTRAAGFLRGEETEEQFIGFRLKQGVYGQRSPTSR